MSRPTRSQDRLDRSCATRLLPPGDVSPLEEECYRPDGAVLDAVLASRQPR